MISFKEFDEFAKKYSCYKPENRSKDFFKINYYETLEAVRRMSESRINRHPRIKLK